jgi:hypothetical protein
VGQTGFSRISRSSNLCDLAEEKWSGRRGSNSQLSAWESEFAILYFQYLQNRSEKIRMHAMHTVHAVPDLRVAAGRLRDGVSVLME